MKRDWEQLDRVRNSCANLSRGSARLPTPSLPKVALAEFSSVDVATPKIHPIQYSLSLSCDRLLYHIGDMLSSYGQELKASKVPDCDIDIPEFWMLKSLGTAVTRFQVPLES